MGKKRCFLY